MDHTFLVKPGRWRMRGHQLVLNQPPVPLQGTATVEWDQLDWFQISIRLVFEPDPARAPLVLQYRGRMDPSYQKYTFVMQHSQLGRVEGEGWVTPANLVHRYWVLKDDKLKRSGLETFFQAEHDRYGYNSGVISGLRLLSSLEAVIEKP